MCIKYEYHQLFNFETSSVKLQTLFYLYQILNLYEQFLHVKSGIFSCQQLFFVTQFFQCKIQFTYFQNVSIEACCFKILVDYVKTCKWTCSYLKNNTLYSIIGVQLDILILSIRFIVNMLILFCCLLFITCFYFFGQFYTLFFLYFLLFQSCTIQNQITSLLTPMKFYYQNIQFFRVFQLFVVRKVSQKKVKIGQILLKVFASEQVNTWQYFTFKQFFFFAFLKLYYFDIKFFQYFLIVCYQESFQNKSEDWLDIVDSFCK
eukprot:TRINITY_DN3269_c0_g1_i5.p1 TRINITY_DN3269_c0_g1~~TRINITY_DN3269_c0_g1_i5.p1  ORF type:complete len:261 (-),score=-31.53 TRINITY_DN3269_c0_g1_i5:530-1312(-)